MKKKLAIFIMAAALVLSMPMASFATETPTPELPEQIGANLGGDAAVMSVVATDIGVTRHNSTSGTVDAYATFSSNASTAVCTIYLQEKYNGSWRTATGLGTTSYTKTAYNCNSITAGKTFTLISGKVYRAKCVFSGIISGTTYTKTVYSGAF